MQNSTERDKKKIPTVPGGVGQRRVETGGHVHGLPHDGDGRGGAVQDDDDKMGVA